MRALWYKGTTANACPGATALRSRPCARMHQERPRSSASKFRWPLFQETGDPLAMIFRVHQVPDGLDCPAAKFTWVTPGAATQAVLHEAEGKRRVASNAARELDAAFHEAVMGHNLADQPYSARFLGIDGIACEQEFRR